MKFQLMIAKRFMLGGRGSGPSRLTGWISIIGMMVGTFAMIITLAVMNGFEKRVINKLIGFEGDIRITAINKHTTLEQAYNKVRNDASIDMAMLYKERVGMIIGRDDIKMKLEKTFSDHLSIKTWEDLHRGLISAMRVERLGALAVLCLIILVASFNLVSTLVLVIIQKIREIGILRAIGTSKINIKKIILTQGSLIGGVGIVIGIGISTVFIFIQNQYGIIPLPADVYFINQLPMVITTIDLLVVLIIAIFFVLFSGLIASKRATIIDIRESLQWEK